jgi:hypothetical protein
MSWDNPLDKVVSGPEFLKDMEDQMVKIKKNLRLAQDRKKSYVYKKETAR